MAPINRAKLLGIMTSIDAHPGPGTLGFLNDDETGFPANFDLGRNAGGLIILQPKWGSLIPSGRNKPFLNFYRSAKLIGPG